MSGVLGPTLLLRQTAAQNITSTSATDLNWGSAIHNSGPSAWWSSGSPSSIVMPYTGAYLLTAQIYAPGSSAGYRMLSLLNSNGDVLLNNAVQWAETTEGGGYVELSGVFKHSDLSAEGASYRMSVYQTSGTTLSTTPIHGFPHRAFASFTYLGAVDVVDVDAVANAARSSAKAFSTSIG